MQQTVMRAIMRGRELSEREAVLYKRIFTSHYVDYHPTGDLARGREGASKMSGRILPIAALLFSSALPAAGPDPGMVVQGFQSWLDGTEDLQGKFEQTMVSGAFGPGLAESGKMYVERPGRMRWDYLEPERKVALLDGGLTRLYLEEEMEMIEGRLEDESELLPELLTGDGRIAERFEASLLDGPEYRLRLVPRGEGEPFAEVVLQLSRAEFAIQAAEVLDAAGNRMLYRFTELQRNRGLPQGIFLFEPPPGTSVLGSH
jgi:outer membrane lipoprotein carrier protein